MHVHSPFPLWDEPWSGCASHSAQVLHSLAIESKCVGHLNQSSSPFTYIQPPLRPPSIDDCIFVGQEKKKVNQRSSERSDSRGSLQIVQRVAQLVVRKVRVAATEHHGGA
jgi:hypothetical protein